MTERSIRALFDALYPDVFAYVRRRCATQADAEDVTAETFATVWQRFDDLPAEWDDRRAWVFGVARNHLAHLQRSRARRGRLDERVAMEADTVAPVVADIANNVVASMAVRDAFSSLSAADQEVLQLTGWEQLPAAQAAQVIGCSTQAYESRLRRARRRLTDALTQQEPDTTPLLSVVRDGERDLA